VIFLHDSATSGSAMLGFDSNMQNHASNINLKGYNRCYHEIWLTGPSVEIILGRRSAEVGRLWRIHSKTNIQKHCYNT
jgi:hypothetical protein